MNDDNGFNAGLLFGMLTILLLLTVVWYAEKHRCQRLHNVASCVLADQLFVPALNEGN